MSENGNLTLAQLSAMAKEGTIDTVLVALVDMQGRLIGKRFHVNFFLDIAEDETHGCDYLLANDMEMEPVPGFAASSWARGYGDFAMKPDLSTLRLVPWLEATALVLCDVLDHHHEDVAHSPRAILKKQLARLEAAGYWAFCASELEFYLFDEDYRTLFEKSYRDPKTAGYYIEDYHIFQTSKEEPVMRAMRNGLENAGIPVENSKGEWGPGQEELNVRYAKALTMADRHVIMKNGCKEIAHQYGKAITFMAKWRYDLAGSSCHIHMSLRDKNGTSLSFRDETDPLGMSATMKHFLAGQIKYAPDITLFLAPMINSYKRFQAGTFAPTKLVWSNDNRTAGFRLCGANSKAIRVECRIGGADLNPYLAYAALIAAGLKGIEEKLALGPAYHGDAYGDEGLNDIPATLRAAIDAFAQSDFTNEVFGAEVVAHYAHAARWEQAEYDRRVTDFELIRGFERA